MSDLRESESIEQDADREENHGKAELILAKNRNGPTGNVELTFLKELMRFETRAPEPH